LETFVTYGVRQVADKTKFRFARCLFNLEF